jgi:uncharacterized protein YecE (DUF72 family)
MGAKLGPILLHRPSCFPFNGGRLDVLCKVFIEEFRYAFEFRDPSWFHREACDILKRNGMAFCIHDRGRLRKITILTSWKAMP